MSETPDKRVVDIGSLRRSCAACALSQLCLPATIDGEDLRRLDEAVRQHRPIERGSALFREGEPFTDLFVVRAGSLKTYAAQEDGLEQVLGFHLPGDIIGLDAVAEGAHRCSAEALERANVCMVPFAALNDVARQVPGLQRQLYRVISREFVRDQEHLATMGRKQAHERLAIFLKSLSDRRRALSHEPFELELSMSRADIANYLGLVIETVSRLFGRFQDEGVLEVQRKSVHIRDYDALARIASGARTLQQDPRHRAAE